MKKLLQQLLLLLLIVAALAYANLLVNEYLFDRYNHKLAPGTETVVCGASISRNALNDSIIPNCENISVAARSAMDFFLVSKRILRDNPQVERIITDYTIQGLSGFRDYMFFHPKLAQSSFGRIYPLADYKHLSDYRLNTKLYIKSLLRHKLTPDITYWKNMIHQWLPSVKYEIPYIGYYENRKGNDLDAKTLKEGLDYYFYFKGKPYPVGYNDLNYIDSIVVMTGNLGVECVLFAGPIHPDALEVVPEHFMEAYKKGIDRFRKLDHVTILEYTSVTLPDSCFANHNHMNYRGAEIISHMVKDTLNL